jgi:hypothetical protein
LLRVGHADVRASGPLVVANATWAGCAEWPPSPSPTRRPRSGIAHLAGEGVFVGVLAALEWRERERLRDAT